MDESKMVEVLGYVDGARVLHPDNGGWNLDVLGITLSMYKGKYVRILIEEISEKEMKENCTSETVQFWEEEEKKAVL